MKDNKSLVVHIYKLSDIDKITANTKYINIDITNCNDMVLSYFKKNGNNYLYSEIINGIPGYIYVNYEEFIQAENIIDMIYLNMPKDLSGIEIARYLYISIGKLVSFDINLSIEKSDFYNLNLISNTNNLWGGLCLNSVNDISVSKIYYYLCRRLDIDISFETSLHNNNFFNKLNIDNQILYINLFKDIPYIQSLMKTKYFGTYNDDINMDKKIKYLKNNYNDYYLDKMLKKIDCQREDFLKDILSAIGSVVNVDMIKSTELSVIYKYIFLKYYPNYDIKINNLYLNNKNKNHFIIISYNDLHYSYNYRKKTFVKITEIDLLDNLKREKICLYQNELLVNINY